MTMTHSTEVTNESQEPCTYGRECWGNVTTHKKNLLSLYTLLSKQRGLLVLCIETVHRVTSRV